MKKPFALTFFLKVLFLWQTCLVAEVKSYKADVCVYGGTASGVMAALASEKEGSKVILIEPTRYLGGMTGGGINHLDWGKGETVGGSTYKILMEGLKDQKRAHGGHAKHGIGNKQYRERFKKLVKDRGITVIYDHRVGKVQVGDETFDKPTRQQPIAMGEKIPSKNKNNSIQSIVLWSDHGYHLGDKTSCGKTTLWEKANHVPFIIVAPGITKPGTRIDTPVGLVDIYPTLLDLAGLPAKPDVDGQSLVPLLKDPRAKWDRPALMTQGRGNHAVRSRDWRYIHYKDGTEELYDMEHDPLQFTNLADQSDFQTTKKSLTTQLQQRLSNAQINK